MAEVVNDPQTPLNDLRPDRPGNRDPATTARGPRPDRQAVLAILLLWAVQFAAFSIDRYIRDPMAEAWDTLAARLVVTGAGILFSLLILGALRRVSGRSFLARSITALALALAAAAVHSLVNVFVFRALIGPVTAGPFRQELAETLPPLIFFFSWVHLAIAVVLLSLAYRQELVQKDRRLAEVAGQLDALKQLRPGGDSRPHLWVRTGRERVRVDIADIDWIAAEGEYVRFHCGERSWLDRRSMGELDRLLEPLGFVRVHRSAIVNGDRVESLGRTESGSVRLKLSTGQEIRVGKAFAGRARDLVDARAEALRPPVTSGRK